MRALRRSQLVLLGSLTVMILAPSVALAWADEGHRIVATIAADRLTPHATAAVTRILKNDPTGHTLPDVATWADTVRGPHERPWTYNWHFVDIPVNGTPQTYKKTRDCKRVPKGDCVIAALKREVPKLTAKHGVSTSQRAEALKYVTHFVGDMHQPLHCAERNHDRGANDVVVTFFGATHEPPPFDASLWNLHAVWDAGLIEHQGDGEAAYVKRLEQWIGTQNASALESGTYVDWGNASHALAADHAYKLAGGTTDFPATGGSVDQQYYDANIDIVDQQLAKAGVRLARVLNDAFP